uniref:Myeloid differentiation factor 88 n=1 Tax=Pinctada fucata TaxID=50426 RepID=A0A2U6KF89_PINFU|nr:myeloid differentiation factor 88 [Pinctada fucata]
MSDNSSIKDVCKGVPLHALNMAVRNKMASFLDPEGFVTGDFCNDYTGLAECAGFQYEEIKRLQSQRKPTLEFLHEWGTRQDRDPYVDVLISHLERIGRPDVIDECRQQIVQDVQKYKRCHEDLDPVQSKEVSCGNEVTLYKHEIKSSILTKEEALDPRQACGSIDKLYYDGFVIYNPNGQADLNFVKELADRLEGPEYGLKLFIPFRDDLPGTARYEVTAEIIANRCKRALVILSPSFLQSPAADFQLKFAQCLSPGARSKKVVPVFNGRCKMPNILRAVNFVDFTNPGLRDWNWPRLAAVLKCPLEPDIETYMNKEELAKIKMSPDGYKQVRDMFALSVALTDFKDFE